MKLLVPANYDEALVPQLASLGVTEMYGKLPNDVVGGGRPAYMSTPLAKRRLAAYVGMIRRSGMGFNYLLNSACLGNRECTSRFRRQFEQLLGWLEEIGADSVTVVSPMLLKLAKRHRPRLRVKVGIYAQIDSVQRALYWESLGADSITLESFSLNRDFRKLASIREAVRCELVLIANHLCLPSCPLQVQHQNAFAHASGAQRRFLLDHCFFECNERRLRDKALLIAAAWIRPEDVHRYEALGYDKLKLLERDIPSAALLERVRAYSQRVYQGNFAELLFSWGFSERAPRFSWLHTARMAAFWRVRPGLYPTLLRFLELQGMLFNTGRLPIVIDPAAIPPDFLEFFRRAPCADRECRRCGYCASIAEKAVRIDEGFLQRVLPLYEAIQGELLGASPQPLGRWGARA